MKPDIKKKWVKALRSGKYRQTTNTLKSEAGFCCLGVLSDLYIKEHKRSKWIDGSHNGKFYFVDSRGKKEGSSLPHSVMRWAGIKEPNPQLELERSAISANDSDRKDFKEIADLIEQSL